MSINTSKFTVADCYRKLARFVGEDLAPGEEATSFSIGGFIDNFNYLTREYAGETQMLHRLAVILPNHNWLRYIQCTHQQTDKSMIRIDLEGQTVSTLSAEDPDCLDWQYEKQCTGDGVDPNYAGVNVDLGPPPDPENPDEELNYDSPDSFPKIYLPLECNIPEAAYGYTEMVALSPVFHLPRGHQVRIGDDNEPLTPCLVDMRSVGYGALTPGVDGYPLHTDYNNYFIDPFLICALRLIEYTVEGRDFGIPYSADEYLNKTWAEILGLVTTGDAAINSGNGHFTIDGVSYLVTVTVATWNVALDTAFVFTITDGVSTWEYTITPSYTPWQTVGTQTDRWGNLFRSSTLYANRAMYIVVNDWNLRLPDDLLKIKWVWKLPTDKWYYTLPEDATDDMVLTHIADSEREYYNSMDYATHYFPLTEGAFTRSKMQEVNQSAGYTIAGYYVQLSQQLRIVPRTTDPIAVYYVAKPDLIPNDLEITDLPNHYVELPGIAIEVIVYKLAWEYFISAMGGDSVKAKAMQQEYYRSKDVMDKLFKGRGGQDMSAPMLRERIPVRAAQRGKYFGSLELGEP
jgi:hypothetical protein